MYYTCAIVAIVSSVSWHNTQFNTYYAL